MTAEAYFAAYADMEVHRVMLEDKPRLSAYKRALEALDLRGKCVLDVGAGTGLLSLLAARCGARRVYAVEASDLALHLPAVMEANGFSSVVTVLRSRVEDVELPEKADVLVSEWMGFHLLHEDMLASVLHARDALLQPHGLMLPCVARVLAAPVNLDDWAASQFGLWAEPYDGLDLSAFLPSVAAAALAAPLITALVPSQLVAPAREVAVIDLTTTTLAELEEVGGAALQFCAHQTATVHGYALWFTVEFPDCEIELSTSPASELTHWKQTVVLLPEMLAATAGQSRLDARIWLRKDADNPRECAIELELIDEAEE
jgi:protein arginine N-methyltransferase 1/protein arginine N-methyltransferase 6